MCPSYMYDRITLGLLYFDHCMHLEYLCRQGPAHCRRISIPNMNRGRDLHMPLIGIWSWVPRDICGSPAYAHCGRQFTRDLLLKRIRSSLRRPAAASGRIRELG